MARVKVRLPLSLLEDVGRRDWDFRNQEVCGSCHKLSMTFSSLTAILTYPLSQAASLNDGYHELVRERDRHDFRVDSVDNPRCLLGPRWIRSAGYAFSPPEHVAGHWDRHSFLDLTLTGRASNREGRGWLK